VLAAVDNGARTADELVRGTHLPAGAVAAALVELELAGLVSAASGVYRR
jgi:predicted Rossmann fold nucleotide-binding protein DprA/Smf involved in DNA uptake